MGDPVERAHSEEWFKAYRDFWWNADFLELMARRLKLDECRKVLDLGCGQCHWSRALLPFLGRPAEILAIDRDSRWARGSAELEALFRDQGAALTFRQGDAHALPCASDALDLATCQTTLIHLREPRTALREMQRVVRPGGLVLCAEPNNLAAALMRTSLQQDDAIEATLEAVRHALVLERGKARLGEGDDSCGDLLVGLFAELGFEDIRVYLSDKAIPVFPPYAGAEQQAAIQSMEAWDREHSGPADEATNRRYARAFGDQYLPLLERMRSRADADMLRFRQAIRDRTYFEGGASVMYLVSGRKRR